MKRAIALGATLALLLAPVLVRFVVAQAPSAPPPPPPIYTLTDLGPLNITAAPSGATALNASGQITGFRFENFPNTPVCLAQGANEAFLWNPSSPPPPTSGTYTELGTLGGASGFGYGINNTGQIAGGADICVNKGFSTLRAFIWQNGTMTALDPSTNAGQYSTAFAINTNGTAAGYIVNYSYQPVIWKTATIVAPPNGAVRSNTVVTITTTSAHNFATGDSVTISGVADISFNGTFTVASVPSSTTFTYGQSAADGVSGSGIASDQVMLADLHVP